MTGARSRRRTPRRTFATPVEDPQDALSAVEEARADVEATRRRVSAGEDGSAALHAAEYRLAGALQRLDRAGWVPPSMPDDPDAAWTSSLVAVARKRTVRKPGRGWRSPDGEPVVVALPDSAVSCRPSYAPGSPPPVGRRR